MSIKETIGEKFKSAISKSPIVEKSIEGVVSTTKKVALASMHPEENPEITLTMSIAGAALTIIGFFALFNQPPKAEDMSTVFRTITINNYYGTTP